MGTVRGLPLPPTSRENLRLDCYLEYPPATKALYIYKYPCLLRDSNPGPSAQQSTSRTTIPDGWLKLTVVTVAEDASVKTHGFKSQFHYRLVPLND
ncbi:uncharacterized protein TNCV_258961 [Trichonephila clavipes]|uniref:Uncharacterized protein n=1 Tax=Trichonephila clavipes TaxID=2585209 RepID=A0A8X6RW32_TRICX|nr:uncharacterized protein TNCV_258961 [Trichonephila clavipes]